MRPLPLATRLYHDVVGPVTHLASLEARMRETPRQPLRVFCAPDMLMHRLAPGLNVLRRQAPELEFSFTQEAREADIALVSEGCIPETHSFVPLLEEPFRLAVSRHHPLACMTEVAVDDLRAHPLLHRPYCPQADRAELAPFLTASAAQAVNDQQLLDLVAAGLGIAFVPLSHGAARDDITLLTLTGAEAGTRVAGISHRKSAFARDMAHKLCAATRA